MNHFRHNSVNCPSAASQISVVRIEGINNSQVSSLHILEQDLTPEMLPHVFIAEGSLPLLIGPEHAISVQNQIIPVLNETRTKMYPQFSLCTKLDTSFVQTKPLVSALHPAAAKPIPGAMRNPSTHHSINELINPLNCTIYKSPTKRDGIQNEHSLNEPRPKSNSKDPGFINSPSNANDYYLNTTLDVQSFLQVKPHSTFPYVAVKKEKDAEVKLKDNDEHNRTVKRKVQNYVHISDVRVPQRAIAVLPTALQIRGRDNIFPRRTLPARIRFGPVEGIHKVVTPAQVDELKSKSDAPVFLLKNDNVTVHVDVTDKDKCNWMGLLPLGIEANVWLYQENYQLYTITTEPINARKPLKLGYSKKYAEDHKLPTGVPTLDLETVLSSNPKQWWCNECNRALPSASLLQRHADVYHKDDIISTRRGYRCLKCRRVFSRLFTLRRHISKHCTEKEKIPETTEPNPELNSTPNETPNNEETRIPSDESFQNFTNGLDFSSSLFDTDRISNLDISSNSRADDFNPYDITFRDDICVSNDLSVSKLITAAKPSNSEVKESAPESCTYCSKTVTKGNRRKHLRDCPTRKLECACGKIFKNKDKLAQHFLKEHSSENASETENKSEKKNYTCEKCDSKRFKRRGMLVNHLWRAHKIVSTSKVERPVRHYPCVACAKIYRSAAKRARHITVHHPGAEKLATQTIAGGVRSCEPAACDQCPRQYATRAKLLQHVRTHHGNNAHEVSGKLNFTTANQ